MRKRISLTVLCLTLFTISFSQTKNEDQNPELKKKYTIHYFNNISMGLIVGSGKNFDNISYYYFYPYNNSSISSRSLLIINGIEINRKSSFGFTTGIEQVQKENVLSLMTDYKYHFLKNNFQPYLGASVGYAIGLSDFNNVDSKGGYNFSLAMGIRDHFNDKTSLTFEMGYRRQQYVYTIPGNTGDFFEYVYNYNLAFARIGFTFR